MFRNLKNISLACIVVLACAAVAAEQPDESTRRSRTTRTPIKHLIVVVGENISFDALFGGYVAPRGQTVLNLLSQRIIRPDGTPGPNYTRTIQHEGSNRNGLYTVPPDSLQPLPKLPQPTLAGVYNPTNLQLFGFIPDPRFALLTANGPFQLTHFVDYNNLLSATEDPVHRFFQMWQQTGGSNVKLDQYSWVATTAGQGGDTTGVTPLNPGQGGGLMGFFNMASGDAPFFRQLAQHYALSDNYHQAVMGGTGANFFALATAGDAAVFNVDGARGVPPANQIEDPNPSPGADNFYRRDGYSGGSYVNCSDPLQPGVAPILRLLRQQGQHSNCVADTYYLVNNYDPPYNIDGTAKPLGADKFVYPPQTVPTIGEALSAKSVTWKWYTGGRDAADVTSDAFYVLIRSIVQQSVPPGTPASVIDAIAFQQAQPLLYNTLGDPLNGSANIVGTALRNNLRGLDTFYRDVASGTMPAVSFVVPKNVDSGHPGFSVPARYELFISDLLQRVQANASLWQDTAVVITTDEGGGYFDTGVIANLDFFGDGPRVPLLVVSPFARNGYVDHVYNDHASIIKFIEHNWQLSPLSSRSRDRLPNPELGRDDRYRPRNGGIGDLTSLFDFGDDNRK
jgi:acid phosphatase